MTLYILCPENSSIPLSSLDYIVFPISLPCWQTDILGQQHSTWKKALYTKSTQKKSKHRIWPSSVHPFKLDRGFIEIKTKNMMMLKEQVQTCKASSQLFDYLLLSDVNIFESIIVVSTTVLELSYYTCLMVLYSSCTIMWAIGQYWHIVIYTSVILIFLI